MKKMEHPPTSSALEDLHGAIAGLRAQLESLNTVSSAVNDGMRIVIEDRNITITALCSELAEARKDRASIVAFLNAEAAKFATAAAEDVRAGIPLRADRLDCKASILQTMAAYIARGDDRQGGQ